MADKKFNIIFDVDANIGPVKTAVSNLQSALSKINIPDSFKKGLSDTFTKLDNEIKNFESIASKGFTNLADVNKAEKSFDRVTDLLSKLRTEAARLKGVDPNKLLPKETIDKTKALHSEWVKLKAAMDKGFGNTAEIAKQNQELDKQNNKLTELQGKYNDLAAANKTMGARRGTLSQSLDADTKKTTELVAKMQELEKVKGGNRTAEYKQLSGQLEVLSGSIKRNQTEYDNLGKKINENKTAMAGYSTQITSTENTISQITATIEQLKSAAQQTPEGLTQLREKLAEIQNVNLDEIPTDIDEIGRIIQNLNVDQVRRLAQSIDALEPEFNKVSGAAHDTADNLALVSDQMHEMTEREKEIEQLANRVKTFFSIGNTVQLFKRAVKSAIDTVKELDEVMTQAAVVTKFDVSGMWAQLPEYTKRANELGVTVKGVYEASTLYYQQGLETEQVIGVTNETLKMAKIAGLDYATATNYMTSALRGFNMEVNELSAQKVNDIYSQLAAKTASNVEEISVAMSKVAPLAHNAGMEIETTAAMLAQMIEKTREAPETLGTAMKTVIARFQELKKDPALIEPIEGEMVDANKVETALNTIGVALRDTSGQFRQLDEVFLEISQKWDSLDVNTQRYIATIAAGSRQQSRFIAMMADYARTTDLVNLANNAAGASAEQFEKTQASLATALNRLKNAWDQFAMGLANNDIIKKVIDLITGFINIINKAINKLSGGSGLIKSILNLGALLGGIKLARAAFNGFFGWLLKGSKVVGLQVNKNIAKAAAADNINKSTKIYKKFFATITSNAKIVKKHWDFNTTSSQQQQLLRKELQATTNQMNNLALQGKTMTSEYSKLEASAGLLNSQLLEQNKIVDQAVKENALLIASTSKLNEEEAKELATSLLDGTITEDQINLMGVETALKYARAKASGNSAKASLIEANAQATENALRQGGIAGLLTEIGLLVTGQAEKEGETAVTWKNVAAKIAETIAQNALNTSMLIGLGIILAIIAAAVLLVVAIVAITKAIKKTTLSEKMKDAAEQTKKAKEAADKAKSAYDDLLSDRSEYDDLQQRLKDLTYGTQEWKEALIEANQEVLKLIQAYPQLARYIGKGEFGQLIISNEGWDEQITIAQQRVAMTSGIVTFSQARERALENESAQRDFNRAFEYFDVEDFFVKAFTSTLLPGILDLKYTVDEFNNGIETGKTFGASRQEDVQNDLLDLLQNRESLSVDEFNTQLEAMEEASHLTEEQFKNATAAAIEYNNALEESKIIAKQTAKAFLEANLDYETFKNLDEGVADKITNVFADYMNSDAFQRRNSAMGDVLGYGMASYYQDKLDELAKQYNVQAYMKKNDADQNLKVVYAAIMGLDVTKLKDIKATKVEMGKAVADAISSSDILDKLNSVGEHWEQFTLQNRDKILLAASQGESYRGESKITKDSLQLTATEEQIVTDIFGSIENFIKEYNKAIEIGSDDLKLLTDKIENKIGKPISDALADLDLDNNAKKVLGNKLLDVFKVTGAVSAQELSNTIFDIFGQLKTQEDIDNFARAIHSIDWTDAASINTLSDTIKNLGLDSEISIDIINDLEKQIIEANKALSEVNFEQLEEQLKSIGQIAYNLGTGKQGRGGFSEEDRNLLIEKGIAEAKDFVFSFESGDYTYVGDSIQSLIIAINANTDALLGETNRTIDQKINTAQAAYFYSSGQYLSEQERKMFGFNQGKAVKDFVESGYGPYGKDYLNGLTEEERESAIKEIWDYMIKEAGKIETYQEEKDQADWNNSVYKLVNDYRNNPMGLLMTNGDTDTKRAALVELAVQAEITEDAITSLNNVELASVIQSVQAADGYEIEREELDAYAKALKNTDNAQVKNLDDAYKLAVANKRLEKGYADLKNSGEEWYKILSEATDAEDKATPQYLKASEDYRKAIQNIINADTELSEEWLDKNIENLNKAIQGDKSALDEIVISAIVDTSGIEESTPEIDKAISEVLNNYQDIKIGAYVDLNTDSAIVSLYNFLVAANKTVPQIQALFDELGWEADIDYVEIVKPSGATVKIPKSLTSVRKKTAGPAGVSLDDLKGSGTGGSGGGKDAEWENPYDRLYNYLKEINGQLRIREQLEKRYNRLIKLNVETGQSLKENIDSQIASLEEQNRLQKIVSEERLKDIKKIQAENEDLTKYGWFEEGIGVGGEVHINWDLINDVDEANDEELGKRIEDYISKMEEWADSRHEAIDAIEDNTDAIIELREIGKEEYKDLEDRALDAIIGHQQRLIDEQEKINNSINEANEALTDAISKNIEKIRQDRQNQETETSLAEKERRLAYLRQDTTGSNAVEIKKLEKDLEKERQNYTDSLIDQSLNDLKEQNDAAAKQREKQIELMQSQLDWQTETGYYVNQVTEMVQKMVAKGIIDETDPLYGLLQENEAYYENTNASRQEWFEELKKTIAEAYVYQQNGGTDNGGGIMSNMLTVASAQDFAAFAGLEQQRNEKIRSQGLQDEWPETRMVESYNNGKQQNIDTENSNYMQDMMNFANSGNWAKVFEYAGMRDNKLNQLNGGNTYESFWEAFDKWYKAGQRWSQYASGGLADYTGPAWLDGTKSRPEMVLNARDTQNFLELRDILSSMAASGTGNSSVGNFYCDIDINVGEISNDYDVDRIAARIKQSIYEDSTYRNVNAINFLK